MKKKPYPQECCKIRARETDTTRRIIPNTAPLLVVIPQKQNRYNTRVYYSTPVSYLNPNGRIRENTYSSFAAKYAQVSASLIKP